MNIKPADWEAAYMMYPSLPLDFKERLEAQDREYYRVKAIEDKWTSLKNRAKKRNPNHGYE